ncbi:MAG: hypothetical protein R2788_21705 [Saprospiraceae bacterium]
MAGTMSALNELTDPDNDGIYELSFDFGASPIGRQEFANHHGSDWQLLPWWRQCGGTTTKVSGYFPLQQQYQSGKPLKAWSVDLRTGCIFWLG